MLIKSVHIDNDEELKDVRVTDGQFTEIATEIKPREDEKVIDGNGTLMLPPFVDSHVHLDATLTAGEPEWNETGNIRWYSDLERTEAGPFD